MENAKHTLKTAGNIHIEFDYAKGPVVLHGANAEQVELVNDVLWKVSDGTLNACGGLDLPYREPEVEWDEAGHMTLYGATLEEAELVSGALHAVGIDATVSVRSHRR